MSEEENIYEQVNLPEGVKTRSRGGELPKDLYSKPIGDERKRKGRTGENSEEIHLQEPPGKKPILDKTPVVSTPAPSTLPSPLLEFRDTSKAASTSSSEPESVDSIYESGQGTDQADLEQKEQFKEPDMATSNTEEDERFVSGILPVDLQNWSMNLDNTFQVPLEVLSDPVKKKQLEDFLGQLGVSKMGPDWLKKMEEEKRQEIEEVGRRAQEAAFQEYRDQTRKAKKDALEILDEAVPNPQPLLDPSGGATSKRPFTMPSILKTPAPAVLPKPGANRPSLADGIRLIGKSQFKNPNSLGERSKRSASENADNRPRSEESDRDSGRSSVSSFGEGQDGLHRLMSHITKPIAVLLDKDQRNDQEALERSSQHLNKIRPSTVAHSLRQEAVIQETNSKVDYMSIQMAFVVDKLEKLSFEAKVGRKASTDKINQLRPNPAHTYPSEAHRCTDEQWIKAVKSMESNHKQIEKSLSYKDNVYNFALELGSSSNIVASNYGLSKAQQKSLIMSFIPTMSPLYNDLIMTPSLDKMFEQITINCDLLCTKPELEDKINRWSLDYSSNKGITHSVLSLKDLFIMYEDKPVGQIDVRDLYEKIFTRIRKEKLSLAVTRKVDEARLLMPMAGGMVEYHNLILTSLKDMIYYKPRPFDQKAKSYVVQEDHQLALMYDGDGTAVEYIPPSPQSEKKKKKKKDKKPTVSAADTAPVKKQVEQQGEQRKKTSFAQQWPQGKIYLNKSGNNLTKECNEWFRGFCFKCGHSSHEGSTCRIYPEKDAVLTLCSTCCLGFHTVCKNWKFVGKPDRQRDRNYDKMIRLETENKDLKKEVKEVKTTQVRTDNMITAWAQGAERGPRMGQYYPYPPPPSDLPKNFQQRSLNNQADTIDIGMDGSN
jgi:hypothetical protein